MLPGRLKIISTEWRSMSKSLLLKLAAVGGACTAIGAGAGILGTSAASTTSTPSSAKGTQKSHHRHARGLLGRAVHADAVVPTKGGQFVQVTLDRGVVQSVSGQQLTMAEGTRRHPYKTVTLTIPGTAAVRDNRQAAQLSDLKAGQRVVVVQGPKKTRVLAHDRRTAAHKLSQ